MIQLTCSLVLVALIATVYSTDYFVEKFEDESYKNRWVQSTAKSDLGEFKLSHGKFYGDAKKDLGLQTSQDARFYGISAKFDQFSNEGKSLVIQFTVKHEQKIDCGGGYVKVYPADTDQQGLTGDSPYHIMFGPDICGFDKKKVHVIFTYKGKNLLIKKDIKCKDDEFTHLYTLILNPDNTYEVRIDEEKVESGKLEEDWDFTAPKQIQDPNAKKPSDWVDEDKIDDPTDSKPADWDKPEHVADPDAKKPEDWDDEIDGVWEPPMIDNPEYKGVWKARQIDNPDYKGPWTHPLIDNPDYVEDANLYLYKDLGVIGFDLWQVKSGTIFDNVLITDSVERAEEFGKETWGKTKDAEKKMKDTQDEVERKAAEKEREKREAEGKSRHPPTDDGDDSDAEDAKPTHVHDDEL
jgi:calreticulin